MPCLVPLVLLPLKHFILRVRDEPCSLHSQFSRAQDPLRRVVKSFIMLLLAGAVIFIIYDDLHHYRIRNSITALLGLLFLAWTIARGDYSNLLWHAVFAFGASTLLLCSLRATLDGRWRRKTLGGGFSWVGWQGSLIFSVVLFMMSLCMPSAPSLTVSIDHAPIQAACSFRAKHWARASGDPTFLLNSGVFRSIQGGELRRASIRRITRTDR